MEIWLEKVIFSQLYLYYIKLYFIYILFRRGVGGKSCPVLRGGRCGDLAHFGGHRGLWAGHRGHLTAVAPQTRRNHSRGLQAQVGNDKPSLYSRSSRCEYLVKISSTDKKK